MKTIIVNLLINFVFKYIFSKLFLGTLSGGAVFVASYFLQKYSFPINQDLIGILAVYFFVAGISFGTFNIGNYLFKFGFLSLIYATPIYFFLKLFITYQHLAFVNIGLGLGICLFFELSKIFKFKKRINAYKSLKEIDEMGNGDSYEKGRQFEEYVAELYRQMGFKAVTTTEMRQKGLLPGDIQKRGGSGEQGVDIVAFDHRNKETIIIQCKHYSSKVSNSAIQEIVAAIPLYKANRGIVVTNQYFTEPAKELGFANQISLVDRDGLVKFVEYVNELKNKK